MAPSEDSESKSPRGRKVRVPFRRNRSKPARVKDWTRQAHEAEGQEIDSSGQERVAAKGQISRYRTITVDTERGDGLQPGVVVALRGQFCEVDDGSGIRLCTVRRVLRTRSRQDRNPLAVGDIVRFRPAPQSGTGRPEGVIESVDQRRGQLRRKVRRHIHTMVANVDQVIIVSSTADPPPKPHLIDRYIVATLAGSMRPIVCMNKMDLVPQAEQILERYRPLGYETLTTCAITGDGGRAGIDRLREVLANRSSVMAGQSGVGKSALLNAVQPGLGLRVRKVAADSRKGRHATSTATLIRLDIGGYIVDTPGIRSLDLSTVSRCELEEYFTEFIDHVAGCKFPDCSHTHEHQCAVKTAVEEGLIHVDRYGSYKRLFAELPG